MRSVTRYCFGHFIGSARGGCHFKPVNLHHRVQRAQRAIYWWKMTPNKNANIIQIHGSKSYQVHVNKFVKNRNCSALNRQDSCTLLLYNYLTCNQSQQYEPSNCTHTKNCLGLETNFIQCFFISIFVFVFPYIVQQCWRHQNCMK